MNKRLDSIANLALHPTAEEGEWQAAANAFFRVHRNAEASSLPKIEWGSDKMGAQITFGKYRGATAEWIAINDPGYGEWLLATVKGLSSEFRRTLRSKLDEGRSK